MSKEDCIELEGKVVEILPNTMFNVELQNGKIITCTLSGKLRMNYIKILQGDNVKIEISPYDLTRGRITWRMKNAPKSTTQDSENQNSVSVNNSKSDSIGASNLTKN